jgi:hypothetical protein
MISRIILEFSIKRERKMSYGGVRFGLALLSPVLFHSIAVAQPPAQPPDEFPIVTHWDQTLNGGHGGPKIGGTDAVGGMDGNYKRDLYNNDSTFDNNAPLFDPKNDLYSTGTNAPNAALPAYERYAGENFSLLGLSQRWVTGLAHDTGLSVRHLNGREDCRAADVIPDASFFQVVHACPIGQGDQMSLATVVIPPHWNRSQRYSVLFYPDRDLHFSVSQYGETILTSINKTIKLNKGSAIGVVWNAGVAFGGSGLQGSMYENASRLFDWLKMSFSADTDKIVAVGCSRGASEALAIAGNPQPHSYTVKEVIAYSPDVASGTRYKTFTSPTYPAMIYNLGIFTGYKYAWREEWREDQTGYRGWEVILKNTFNSVHPDRADQLSPIAEDFLGATKTAGTRINLNIDTNDPFMPFANYITYVNNAKSRGIPMHVQINYRGAHCGNIFGGMFAQMHDDSVAALGRVNTDEQTFSSDIVYYRPSAIGFQKVLTGQQPVAIELPSYVTPNGPFVYSVSGAPGVYFKLEIFKQDGTLIRTFSDQLPQMDPPPGAPLQISTYTKRCDQDQDRECLDWLATAPVGIYHYTLSYSVNNTEWKPASFIPGNLSRVGQAEFIVMDKEPMASSAEFCTKMPDVASIVGCDHRQPRFGWGLSSH